MIGIVRTAEAPLVMATPVLSDQAAEGQAEQTAQRVAAAEHGADQATRESTRQGSAIGAQNPVAASAEIAAPTTNADR